MRNSERDYLSALGQVNLDDAYIRQAFDYYRKRYQVSELAQRFVANSCIIENEFRLNMSIGYCDRTMGRHIPKVKTCEGTVIRGCLQRAGLIRASGHELFRGCVVFPSYHEGGNVISAIGYRMGRVRKGSKPVVYWHRPQPKAFVDKGMLLARELIHGKAYH
jgi:hypothetical protein